MDYLRNQINRAVERAQEIDPNLTSDRFRKLMAHLKEHRKASTKQGMWMKAGV